MQSELRQSKPFAHPGEELYLSLIRTTDLLGRTVFNLLKERGLSPAQYNVLRILRGAGPEGLPCGEIAARMVTRDPDVTRLLDRLGQRGLAERGRGPVDRRVVFTRITGDGLALLDELEAPLLATHTRQLGFLGEETVGRMLEDLKRVREHLAEGEGK